MKGNSSVVLMKAGSSLIVSSTGCATKNYVRKKNEPIIDKTTSLDELTAKNKRDMRDADTRAQQGIEGVNAKVTEVDQKALHAGTRADQAQTAASQANGRADALSTQVANLDNYRPVVETSVHFAFNNAILTTKAKDALDQLLAEVPNTKAYLVLVEGDTDSVGPAGYN